MKDYLNVHELAELFGINTQTLHYYDKIGLMRPVYRDPKNGYRKYRFDQTYELASIRYMRKLGYSIEDVRSFQDSRNTEDTIRHLRERSMDLRRQWEELMRIDRAILRKIQFVEDAMKELDLNSIRVEKRERRAYIQIGTEDVLYMDESFYFYPTLVFYGETVKYFGALVTDELAFGSAAAAYTAPKARESGTEAAGDAPEAHTSGSEAAGEAAKVHESGREAAGDLREEAQYNSIREGIYLTGYHKGPYEEIQITFDRMKKQAAELGIELDQEILAINIVDQFIEQDNQNFITKVEMRII